MWFGKNDDFVVHSFSKCYFMPQMSQVLSLKLVIYRLSGLWRMNLISIGRDKNGDRFWREKNAWNKGVNVEKRMALLGYSFLFEGYKYCFLCLKLLIFFLLLLSPTPLPYRFMFVLCFLLYSFFFWEVFPDNLLPSICTCFLTFMLDCKLCKATSVCSVVMF